MVNVEESKYAAKAMKLFREGYNCSQSVLLAFEDVCDIDVQTAAKMSSSFGGGMGRLREVCGGVTGMFMVAGLIYGYDDPDDSESKKLHYERIQELAAQFQEMHGTIICRELLGLAEGKDHPTPSSRTKEYYQNRPCEYLVGTAAAIMEAYYTGKVELCDTIVQESCAADK